MPATPAWLAAVEAWCNRGAQGSPQAAALLQRLERTAVCVDVVGVTSVRADVTAGRLALSAAGSPEDTAAPPPDARIAGSPFSLLALARGGSPRSRDGARRSRPPTPQAGAARAMISGDVEIANLYRQLFAAVRPDFEEELSRFAGDLPARRLSQLAQRTVAWLRRTHRTAADNVAEYLQEESRDLVNAYELDEFLRGVDTARETVDRVEARLSRLEQRIQGSA